MKNTDRFDLISDELSVNILGGLSIPAVPLNGTDIAPISSIPLMPSMNSPSVATTIQSLQQVLTQINVVAGVFFAPSAVSTINAGSLQGLLTTLPKLS